MAGKVKAKDAFLIAASAAAGVAAFNWLWGFAASRATKAARR